MQVFLYQKDLCRVKTGHSNKSSFATLPNKVVKFQGVHHLKGNERGSTKKKYSLGMSRLTGGAIGSPPTLAKEK